MIRQAALALGILGGLTGALQASVGKLVLIGNGGAYPTFANGIQGSAKTSPANAASAILISDNSNGYKKTIVAIYDLNDPKQREWTEMILGALGALALFIVFAKIAVELDAIRNAEKSYQDRRYSKERG